MMETLRRILPVVFVVSVAFSLDASLGVAEEADRRVEGIVEAVPTPNTVLVRTRERLVTVDLAALGGVTISVTQGTKIVAVGTLEPSGEILHAKHLESPASP